MGERLSASGADKILLSTWRLWQKMKRGRTWGLGAARVLKGPYSEDVLVQHASGFKRSAADFVQLVTSGYEHMLNTIIQKTIVEGDVAEFREMHVPPVGEPGARSTPFASECDCFSIIECFFTFVFFVVDGTACALF